MPQKPAYLCLQQVRAEKSFDTGMGFSLAKSPGHRPGSHGQGTVARIRQKAAAKKWDREVTTDGWNTDSFDEKNELDTNPAIRGRHAKRSSQRPAKQKLASPNQHAYLDWDCVTDEMPD